MFQSDLSQSERDKIDSLKARVDFLEGQLEKVNLNNYCVSATILESVSIPSAE